MNPEFHVLVGGMFLATIGTGFGQPVITNQPCTQATAPGRSVTFTVGATGSEPMAYPWQRNIGAGFVDLANGTNASLVLSNVQSWDAWDYRAVVANSSRATTSAVAHLYVMSPAPLTERVVIDNFDDNKLTGWSPWGGGTQFPLLETNRQFVVRGYWPGVITWDAGDTTSSLTWTATRASRVALWTSVPTSSRAPARLFPTPGSSNTTCPMMARRIWPMRTPTA